MPRLSEQDLAHLHDSFDAEAAGDPARALTLHEAVHPFPDGAHRVMLRQLVELGDAVPSWGYARWMLEQVTRRITVDTVARNHLARDDAIRAAHAVDSDPRRPYGMPLKEFTGLLLGHDWVYRQLVVFDHGGLEDFLESGAGHLLVSRAGPVHTWVGVAMGGYRFEGEGGGSARFTELSSGIEIEVLDVGCAGELQPGDCAIGRVVPIDADPGLMFESLPVRVDDGLAAQVAENPSRWLAEVTRAHLGGRLPRLYSWREQHPLLTDVPVWVWRFVLADEAALRRALRRGSPLAGDVVGDAVDVVRDLLPVWARVPPHGRPCLAQLFGAAVLHPGVMQVLREAVASAPNEQAWREIAAHLVEPMRDRVLELADLCGRRPDVA